MDAHIVTQIMVGAVIAIELWHMRLHMQIASELATLRQIAKQLERHLPALRR